MLWLMLLLDNFVQIEFDPSNDNILFLRSHSHTVFIDLSKEIPEVTVYTLLLSSYLRLKVW